MQVVAVVPIRDSNDTSTYSLIWCLSWIGLLAPPSLQTSRVGPWWHIVDKLQQVASELLKMEDTVTNQRNAFKTLCEWAGLPHGECPVVSYEEAAAGLAVGPARGGAGLQHLSIARVDNDPEGRTYYCLVGPQDSFQGDCVLLTAHLCACF